MVPVTRRTAAATMFVVGLVLAGCAAPGPRAETAPGCGMVGTRDLAGLLGPRSHSVARGSLAALRRGGTRASCTTVAAGQPARFVSVRAVRHPRPLRLPARACNAGWVYAGTPDRYAPACQETGSRGSRTVLLARWGDYVVRVTIGRTDRNWGGDPEVALAMTEQVARRLGVPVPAQSASGSSS